METTKATKERRLVDVRVQCEFPHSGKWLHRHYSGIELLERRAKALEEDIREFEEFLRDHRSRDVIDLSVERVVAEVCSACGSEWEIYGEGSQWNCASCGAEVTP